MTTTLRLLVTGSRTWTDTQAINAALGRYLADANRSGNSLTIVHGACPTGADAIADAWAKRHWRNVAIERYPANWDGPHGKAAGFRRNTEMVQLGANLCAAFIRNASKGATHCAEQAIKAGIPVHRYTQEP